MPVAGAQAVSFWAMHGYAPLSDPSVPLQASIWLDLGLMRATLC